jgi:hypothetical protein
MVSFGAGTRLFDNLIDPIELDSVGVAMALLLLHALRQLPLDRLSPVSLVALTGCGLGLLVSYVMVAVAFVRERRARARPA